MTRDIPNRGHITTEAANPASEALDTLATLDAVDLFRREDARVIDALAAAREDLARLVDLVGDRLARGGRLIYVGAGTSGRLAVLDAAECVPTYCTPPELVQALIAGGEGAIIHSVEGAEDDADQGRADLLALNVSEKDAVIGIAASGRTPYALGALQAANEVGALTVAIVCSTPSVMLDAAHIKIAALTGPEVVTGSTRLKAGTAQKMIMNMLSTATMIKLGNVYGNLMVDVRPSNSNLVDRACRIIVEIAGIPYDEAKRLLEASHNEVKTAIVMARRGVSVDEARALLADANGVLRAVID